MQYSTVAAFIRDYLLRAGCLDNNLDIHVNRLRLMCDKVC